MEKHNKSNRSNDNVASQLFLQFPTFLQSHQRFIKNTKHFMSHSALIEQKVTDPSRTAQQNVFQFIRKDFCHWQRVPPSSSINVKRHQEIRCFCHVSLLCSAILFVYASAKLPASTGIEMAIIHLTITVSQLENDIAFAHDSANGCRTLLLVATPLRLSLFR